MSTQNAVDPPPALTAVINPRLSFQPSTKMKNSDKLQHYNDEDAPRDVSLDPAPLTTNPVFVSSADGGLRAVSVRRANPLAG